MSEKLASGILSVPEPDGIVVAQRQKEGRSPFTPRQNLILMACFIVFSLYGCQKPPLPPDAAAKVFLQKIADGKVADAYRSATFTLQNQRNLAAFEAIARELGMNVAKEIRVSPATKLDDEYECLSEIVLPNGKSVELRLTLISSEGEWKVLTVGARNASRAVDPFSFANQHSADFIDAVTKNPVPPDAELQTMVKGAIALFADALRQKSFEGFYEKVSKRWQSQLTPGKLDRAFAGFIEKNVDLTPLAEVDPVIEPKPYIGTDGILMVSGHYLSGANQVLFALKFDYDLPKWRLFGIEVAIRQAPEAGKSDKTTETPL